MEQPGNLFDATDQMALVRIDGLIYRSRSFTDRGHHRASDDALDGAGVAVVIEDGILRGKCSTEDADLLDSLQYEIGEGPCIEAVDRGRAFAVDPTTEGTVLPRFCARAAAMGFSSCAGIPILDGRDAIGSLNLYAKSSEAFDTSALESAHLLALEAAGPVSAIGRLSRLESRAEALTQLTDQNDC